MFIAVYVYSLPWRLHWSLASTAPLLKLCSIERQDEQWKWTDMKKKWPWPNCNYYPGRCPYGFGRASLVSLAERWGSNSAIMIVSWAAERLYTRIATTKRECSLQNTECLLAGRRLVSRPFAGTISCYIYALLLRNIMVPCLKTVNPHSATVPPKLRKGQWLLVLFRYWGYSRNSLIHETSEILHFCWRQTDLWTRYRI